MDGHRLWMARIGALALLSGCDGAGPSMDPGRPDGAPPAEPDGAAASIEYCFDEVFPAQAPPPVPLAAVVGDQVRDQVLWINAESYDDGQVVTWAWDGAGWAQLETANAPSLRADADAVYDTTSKQTLLFGGAIPNEATAFDDALLFDGDSWSRSAKGPSARWSAAMAWEEARAQALLFSGTASAAPAGDTWVWQDGEWTELAASGPANRWWHALAHDPIRGETVLFGGRLDPDDLGDTWVFDGTNWLERNPAASPPRRSGHHLAWDPGFGRIVLFGGGQITDEGWRYLGDVWLWDGVTWAEAVCPGPSPSPRLFGAMAYDHPREQMVLQGGMTTGLSQLTDTWISSSNPPAE